MRGEHGFDYSRAKPNRFAAHMDRPVVAVVLAPDVASVFDSPTRVNAPVAVNHRATQIETAVVASTGASPTRGLAAAAPDGGHAAQWLQ